MKQILYCLLIVCCFVACSNEPESSATNTGEQPTQATNPTAEPTIPSQAEWPVKDLTERPQIWFGPLDPWSWDRYFPGQGSFEFYDIFEEDADWQMAAEATHIMRLYPAWLDTYATPNQLEQVFANLYEREIAFTFESGPLQERGPCNATIEGFNGAPGVRNVVRRIDAAGGVLYGYDLEHGFDAANYSIPECYMTPTEVAEDVAITVAAVRETFPNAKIGSIETANLDVNQVEAWVTAYREVMGEDLDYFHLDVNFDIPDWPERSYEIEQYIKSQGIDFGMIYFGNHDATSDAEWIETAQQRLITYELVTGGRPDHVIFQSWHTHPQQLLPENDPNAFTNMIIQYNRTRTVLDAQVQSGTISGSLTDVNSNPIGNVPLTIEAIPIDGDGLRAEYTVTGIVPEGATRADVGFRVNIECECSSPSSFTLFNVQYTEGTETTNRVNNGNFANGLNGWGFFGSLSPTVTGSGESRGLQVNASASQNVGANSDIFQVTSGATYTVTFVARIAPDSTGSGYFNLIFQNDSGEIMRETIPLEPKPTTLGETTTTSDGSFQFTLANPPTGRTLYRVWYAGDAVNWPALGQGEGE